MDFAHSFETLSSKEKALSVLWGPRIGVIGKRGA